MKSIRSKTKELSRFTSGCHGNPATIAMRYVAEAYRPKEDNQAQLEAWISGLEVGYIIFGIANKRQLLPRYARQVLHKQQDAVKKTQWPDY